MNFTKQQIINGVIKYIKAEVIDKITDKPLKMTIAASVSMVELNPNIADGIFENDVLSKVLHKDNDGTYNIDVICDIIEKTMNEYGDFPVKIPAIAFISPTEKELNFSASDIKKLKDYIGGNAT